jgi:hypothetical protein
LLGLEAVAEIAVAEIESRKRQKATAHELIHPAIY